jgi:molybdopterin converting factor small subunit
MKVRILAFGITRDIVGGAELVFETEAQTLGDLRKDLNSRFPEMNRLKSLFIACNQNYVEDDQVISETDELALIPPVSGG